MLQSLPGDSSDCAEEEEEEESVCEIDKLAVIPISAKECLRGAKQVRVEDLSARQLALSLSGCLSFVLPSDLLELGGEKDSRLNCL